MPNTHAHAQSFDLANAYMMARAVKETCAALRIPPEDKEARAIIAARVGDLAREGLTNAEALRDRVLKEARTEL